MNKKEKQKRLEDHAVRSEPLETKDLYDATGDETGEDLKYNEEAGSFERDTEIPDPPDQQYQHPDLYRTAAPGGSDHMSTYDEANQYSQDANPNPPDE